jgi:hypothetical protein
MFTVNESITDYHVTFVEHFPINTRNATNTFRVTRGLETFEINIYLNGSDTFVSIEMLTGQQETVDLLTHFGFRAISTGFPYGQQMYFSPLAVHDTRTWNLTILNKVMNEAKEVLDGDGVFTIKMTASYLIHSQHTIATSQAQFNAETHTSVNMTYTWTVCNLTLPLVDADSITSEKIFAGLGVAEFYISMYPDTKVRRFVSFYCRLANPSTKMKLPLQGQFVFELIDSGSVERAVIKQFSYSLQHKYVDESFGFNFKYQDIKKLLEQNSGVIFRYRVVYALSENNIALKA